MGNIIESSVESFPSTQELSQGNDSLEDSLNAEPSDAVETQSTRELSPPPGQRRRSSSGPDGPTSRPLSRVLIHGEDSSNIWIPCPDATIAQTTAGPETNAFSLESPNASSLESPNDSLSLSESNIPTTFDTSFDNAEMSHLFAHPGNVEVEVAERPTCMLAVDTKDVLPREPLSMAAEFSHLESTMLELLSSPVPFYPAVMGEMLERSPTEPTEPPVLVTSEPDVRIFNSPNPVDPTNAITNSRSSSPGLPEIIPLVVTTYADATNLAMQYPELAEEILALPLPTPPERVIERDAITEEPRPLSPSLHHPDKPHWAAAPLPDVSEPTSAPVVPQNRGDKNTADSRFRRQRDTKGCDDYGSSVRSAHHDASGSRPPPQVKKAKRRHKPVPHHKGTDHPDLPPHLGISLQRRSSDPPHPCNIAPEIADDDTGTISSPTRNWDCGHTQTAARNAPLMASSCGRPDVDADHKVLSISGADRLGRHIILPRPINANHEPKRRISRQAHKQQVADLSMAARRYLGEGSDRGSGRASSSTCSDQSDEITEIIDASPVAPFRLTIDNHQEFVVPDETPEERFHRLGGSFSPPKPRTNGEAPVREEQTPVLRTGESPLREIQLRTNNVERVSYSPRPSMDPQTPRTISLNSGTKMHMSPNIASLASPENHAVGNVIDTESEWLVPAQHTADDWLPPVSTRQQSALSPSQILHFENSSGAFLPSKSVSNCNNDRAAQIADPQLPFGSDLRVQDTSANWFGDPSFTISSAGSGKNGPTTDGPSRRYPGRARQSLPAQSGVFSQHLTEAYSSNFGSKVRGWRGGGRGARSISAQNARPRDPAQSTTNAVRATADGGTNSWNSRL